jgi:hypothetical protein
MMGSKLRLYRVCLRSHPCLYKLCCTDGNQATSRMRIEPWELNRVYNVVQARRTARFDYLGTGDSGEIDPQADQLEVWTGDVASAAQELGRRSGVTQICFLGIRLGAPLTMLAAAQCSTNSSLVLISPILGGRRYLRELPTIRMAASAGQTRADVAPNRRDAGAMEISGFTFSAATLASLNKYGSWGALESIMQTTTPLGSASPKWQAIQNFISVTPCWRPNCSGTVGVAGKTRSQRLQRTGLFNDRSLSYSPSQLSHRPDRFRHPPVVP